MIVFFVVKRRKTKRFSTDSVDLPAPLPVDGSKTLEIPENPMVTR